jgi:hypothetical protein
LPVGCTPENTRSLNAIAAVLSLEQRVVSSLVASSE